MERTIASIKEFLAMRSAGTLVKPCLAMPLEALDPLTLVPRMGMDCLAGDAEALGEFINSVIVQLVVFEESLSLFAHGNTFPGMSITSSWRKVSPMS
jgi:hypothetical protein